MPSRKPSNSSSDSSQLSLFAQPAPAPPDDPMPSVYAELAPLAARLPSVVRFGTSSWAFPGWRGLVYSRERTATDLSRDGLREYARHPLLRTVGIDRGFYAPIPPADLVHYSEQLPEGFLCCAKAPDTVTAPVRLGHGRGAPGAPNPDFLSAQHFLDTMGGPFLEYFAAHAGPIVFEFPPLPPEHRLHPREFAERLDRFLSQLPAGLTYAVELRDRALLTKEYVGVLAARGVSHTYNCWTAMPLPGAQLRDVPVDTAPFAVVRLLQRPGTYHTARKRDFAPFDRIVDQNDPMRDGVVAIVRAAEAAGRVVYVLVSNKAEGSSPLTILGLAEQLVAALPAR